MASVELPDAIVSQLVHRARLEGLSLEGYLEHVASGTLVSGSKSKLTADELDRLLDAEASRGTTYKGTYPRDEIYRDHD